MSAPHTTPSDTPTVTYFSQAQLAVSYGKRHGLEVRLPSWAR